MSKPRSVAVGFLFNPIAGMGGKVGLHGTDHDNFTRALARGASPVARERALRAFKPLVAFRESFSFVSPHGEMGGDLLDQLGIEYTQSGPVSDGKAGGRTSAEDTRGVVQSMLDLDVEIILFAGGDGTARDIYAVSGPKVPLIGIPAGVKMRSGVFASYPENAAQILIDHVSARGAAEIHVEILDAVTTCEHPEADQAGIGSEFFGLALTLNSRSLLQSPKLSNPHQELGVLELAVALSESFDPDVLYLFGPGRTTSLILQAAGISGSLIGVDAIYNGAIVGEDLSELEILALLESYPKSFLFLGVIGGQGFLLGRGNQQLSFPVLERIGEENIYILAGSKKLSGIVPNRLLVDLDENIEGSFLTGYREVHTSPGRTTLCSLISATGAHPVMI
ncbi:MAG: NAD(+)/NADH kinase [Candidatus Nanopelagicales bacterium]